MPFDVTAKYSLILELDHFGQSLQAFPRHPTDFRPLDPMISGEKFNEV